MDRWRTGLTFLALSGIAWLSAHIFVRAALAVGVALPAFLWWAVFVAVLAALLVLDRWVASAPRGMVPVVPSMAEPRRRLAAAFHVVGWIGAVEAGVLLALFLCGRASPMGWALEGIEGPLADGLAPAFLWPGVFVLGAGVWLGLVRAAWLYHVRNGGTSMPGTG